MEIIKALHPIFPKKNVEFTAFAVPDEGIVLGEVLDQCNLRFDDLKVYVNHHVIEHKDYDTRYVAPDDKIIIAQDVEGGDGSQIIGIIAAISLALIAPHLSAAIVAQTTLTGTAAAFATTSITAAITIAGGLLLTALFQPTVPDPSTSQVDTSPSLAITGIQNRPRLNSPIPIILGKHRVVPDLSAKFWSEWEGENNYAYGVFTLSLNSDLTITDIKMGEDDISNFADIETEFSTGSSGEITLFPTNVDTNSVNADAVGSYVTSTLTSATEYTRLNVDFAGSLVQFNDKGEEQPHSVVFHVQYKKDTDLTWTNFPGSPSGRFTFRNGSTKTFRRTLSTAVDPYTSYEVRVLRQQPEDTDTKKQSNVLWTTLRGFQTDDQTIYEFQKRYAVRLLAQQDLSGTIDAVNMIATSRFPDWNGSSWVVGDTQNPASLFRAVCLGQTDGTGRRIWGAALSTANLDGDSLEEWHDYCSTNNLKFNYVVDQFISCWDLLIMIARVGRATPSFHTGKLGVIIDEENLPVTQTFQLSNIKRDTYEVHYLSEEINDEIVVEYVNEDIGYQSDELRVALPNVVFPENPLRIRIPGITNTTQAGKEANLIAAQQIYRNKRVIFETDFEGLLATKGNVVRVSHDLTSFDSSGRLDNDFAHTNTTVKLNKPVQIGSSPQLRVSHPDGTIDLVNVNPVSFSGSPGMAQTLTLSTSLSVNPSLYPDNEPRDATWQYNADEEPGELLKIVSIEFGGPDGVDARITCFPETDDYYDAEGGSFDHIDGSLFNSGLADIGNVVVSEAKLSESGNIRVDVTFDLQDAIGVNALYIDHNGGGDDVSTETPLGVIYGRSFSFVVPRPTTLTLRLTTIPSDRRRFTAVTFEDTYNIQGIFTGNDGQQIPLMPNVTGLELYDLGNENGISGGKNNTEYTGQVARFRWRKVGIDHTEFGGDPQNVGADEGTHDVWFKDYQVQVFRETGELLRTEYTTDNRYDYDYERNFYDTRSNPIRTFTVEVRARGRQNQLSTTPARLTVTNPAPPVPTGISAVGAFESFNVKLIPPSDPDYDGVIVWYSTSSGFTPSGTEVGEGNVGFVGFDRAIFVDGLNSDTTYYFRVAGFDKFGRTGLNQSSELSVTTATVDIAPNKYVFEDIKFDPEGTSFNQLDWSGGTATVDGTTPYSISSGNVSFTGTDVYVYWNEGDTTLSTTTSLSTAVSTSSQVLGVYKGGKTFVRGAGVGDAFIDGGDVIAATLAGSKIIGGTIAGDRMIADTLTASQIATDAITANELASNSVSAVKIQANAVTSAKINADAVTAGKIATNAITAAGGEIANLAVSTLKIQGNAVTIPSSAYTEGGIQIAESFSSFTTLQSVSNTFDPLGLSIPVIVTAGFKIEWPTGTAQPSIPFRIRRDSTVIFIGSVQRALNASYPYTDYICVPIQDTPGSGSHTYVLEARQTPTTANASTAYNRSISVISAQR